MKPVVLASTVLLSLAALVGGCPKGPVAVLPAITTTGDVDAVRNAFNADAEHRRVLVLLSPT